MSIAFKIGTEELKTENVVVFDDRDLINSYLIDANSNICDIYSIQGDDKYKPTAYGISCIRYKNIIKMEKTFINEIFSGSGVNDNIDYISNIQLTETVGKTINTTNYLIPFYSTAFYQIYISNEDEISDTKMTIKFKKTTDRYGSSTPANMKIAISIDNRQIY